MEKKDLIIGLVSLVILYAILQSGASGIVKFVSSVAMLAYLTEYYKKKYDLQTMYVFLLVRTKKGLMLMSNLAKKHAPFFKAMADVSLAMAFGLSSFWLMRWLNFKERLLSLLTAYVLIFLLANALFPLSSSYFLSFADISKPTPVQNTSLLDLIIPIVTFFGGVVSAISLITLKAAATTLTLIYSKFIESAAVEVAQQATLILPGITISLFEGILALALVLVVHEGSHGILSLIGRVPLRSTGLVFFGSLPVGAFVEPDEEKLSKRPKEVQSRILVGGVGANIFTALIVGLLYLIFLILTADAAVNGCYVISGALPKGTVITAIEGVSGCFLTIPINSAVEITTLDSGTLTLVSDNDGKLNVYAVPIGSGSTIRVYENPILNFIYHLLGLALALNVVVAIVNLIPIPLFDGDHLLRVFVGDGMLHTIIRYSLLAAFLVLLLPGILP